MQPTEALSLAAQVAVTLAGFAGIVVVFRPESIHQWSALDKFRLRLLLANSSLPLALALFGMLLLSINPPPLNIWRWCSGCALLLDIAFFASSRGVARAIPASDFRKATKSMYYTISVLAFSGFVLQIFNIIVWNIFWPFLASLFIHLIAAIAQFVRMVLLTPERS